MTHTMPISIAIADDHNLLAEALSDLIRKFDNYDVLFVAKNGRALLNRLQRGPLPDIALVDLNMTEMDGFETAEQLHPTIRVLALSMTDCEEHTARMIRNGEQTYLLEGSSPSELRQSLDDVIEKGFYYSECLANQLIRSLNAPEPTAPRAAFKLNGREYDFLKLACSELTYTHIADWMCVSPRTVDGYREVVFQKMGVRTRVGMVMKAVRHGLVEL